MGNSDSGLYIYRSKVTLRIYIYNKITLYWTVRNRPVLYSSLERVVQDLVLGVWQRLVLRAVRPLLTTAALAACTAAAAKAAVDTRAALPWQAAWEPRRHAACRPPATTNS